MADSSSAALLAEINSKAKKLRLWPLVVAISGITLVALGAATAPVWAFCLAVPLCASAIYAASLRDRLNKTVVLFYEMEPQFEEAYQILHNSFDLMRACRGTWHVEAHGDVHGLYEWKTHAGADAIVSRKLVAFTQGAPPCFKTNVLVPTIPAGRQKLFFFPDRLLVFAPEGVGAVSYEALNISTGEERFIETTGVPSDARVVGQTWRYVNKSGGPDRRFNNNSEIPIALYGTLQLTSSSGLRELFQISRTGVAPDFKSAAQGLARVFSNRLAPQPTGFLTCPCNHCSGHIEFPSQGVGQAIACPHCGLDTVLFKPAMA